MNKEEILTRAQVENEDEREVQVKDKSITFSYVVLVIMATVFTCIRAEQGLPMMDLCATVCGSVCAGMVYRFIMTKGKTYLLIATITFIVMIFAIVRFAMGH